jgi:uncharacterized protein DUF2183
MTGLRRSKRRPAQAPHGVVYRWDLDKTYLKSEFESLRELVRIPFEKPEDKVAVPGVVPLIRNLRRIAVEQEREVRIFFISASPPQISKAIKHKLTLDRIEYDGIVFKNQLQYLVRGKFRNLREQVGFKLTELLKSRQQVAAQSEEVLFGDDWESDPLIYSLYADILAGRIEAAELGEVLKTIGVDPPLIQQTHGLATSIERGAGVTRIYINLERRTPPTNFRSFGGRLVPTYNYFQTAACLFESGHLTLGAVAEVAQSLVEGSSYTPQRLANSLADIVRRGHLHESSAAAVRDHLRPLGLVPRRQRPPARPSLWQRIMAWLASSAPEPLPSSDEIINYQSVVAEWRMTR